LARLVIRRLHIHRVPSVRPSSAFRTTSVYETFWRFAAERQAIYYRRLADPVGPWTEDAILNRHRFTNCYRAADRVSQYLLRHVQYDERRSQDPRELFFRTLLFKVFNRIETWEGLERAIGPVSWSTIDLDALNSSLSAMRARGQAIYSPAYIMPAPRLGLERKHSNHLRLLARMMHEGVPERIARARNLQQVYETLLGYPGLGRFLAFQYAIDLNYSSMLDLEESDFVVAGPGAIDGISKCFLPTDRPAEELIYWVCDRQDEEFAKRGIRFDGLFGRRLQPIDVQNLFCEISKYARVAHPEVTGAAGRTRIKQIYSVSSRPLPSPSFPPRWGLETGTTFAVSVCGFGLQSPGRLPFGELPKRAVG